MTDAAAPQWLSKAQVLYIHETAIQRHGGSFGLRDEGLLESALAVQKIITPMAKLIFFCWRQSMLRELPAIIPLLLVSGGDDGKLCWWDVVQGTYLFAPGGHTGAVQALRRTTDGTMLASCGDDGAIMLWDLDSGSHRQTLRRDRPYERLDITGLLGITDAQRTSLLALGAIVQID